MAGFLRKKVKQEPQPKPTPIQPGNVSSISPPTPLYARFASTSTSRIPQEPPRIVSSPMLLSSAVKRDGAPVTQNRGERGGAGNQGNSVRRDVRDVETRSQRNQPYSTDRAQEKPKNIAIEHRPHQHQPLAAQPKTRPVSHVPKLDKPLPPPLPPPQADMFNSNVYASNGAGAYYTPSQAPSYTQGFASEHTYATPLQQKSLPYPTTVASNSIPLPRNQAQLPDAATLKHNRSFSVTSPSYPVNPLPNSPPRRLMSAQAVSYTRPTPASRAQKPQPSLPPAHVYETQLDPDDASRFQTLTPQPSNQDLQSAESGFRSDSGAAPDHTTLSPDATISRQYNALLEVAFGEQSTNGNQRQVSRSPMLSGNTLPDSASFQEFDSAFLPGPSSPPTARRKLSKLKPKGQQLTTPHTRLSAAYVERPATAPQPLPAKSNNRRSYQSPSDNMGVNLSSLDVSALPSSYKDVQSHGSILQHRAPLPPVNSNASPQQRIPKQTVPFPQRTSSTMRSANPPPVPGKPLIFAAMAAVNQEAPSTPDRRSITIEPMYAVSNFPPQPPHQAYPSPPAEFSFPPKGASPSQFPSQNGPTRNLNANLARNEQPGFPTPPNQHAAPLQRLNSPQPSSSPPKNEVHTPHMGGPQPLPQSSEQLGIRQSPSRLRKLRTPVQESSDTSVHSRSSSVSGVHHRSPGKPRPVTPVSQGVAKVSQPVIEDDGVGVPLDDDPFAKVEGVKMLKPTSRAGSPEKEGTAKRRRSRGQLSKDGASEDFHSASDGESLHPSQGVHAPAEALPDVSSTKTARSRTSEGRKGTPPIASVVDQQDRLTAYLGDPHMLSMLLEFLSFYEWCMVLALSREIRFMLVQNPQLREAVLERFLKTVGYTRWIWDDPDPLSISLQDLSDYMRGVSTPTHEYSRVAGLYVHSLTIHPSHRDASLYETVNYLAASTRAYTRVVLRLRAQAEKEVSVARAKGGVRAGSRPPSRAPSPTMSSTFSHSNHSYTSPPPLLRAPVVPQSPVFTSPLFRLRRAPLLRVFVPSPDGDWLSDKSVLECEAECRRAGVMHLMRVGDVVWDVAVGDEGNVGRLVWDGSYLLDLDYTYTPIGDLPKYMPTLAFPPSYFHRVIRTGVSSSNPIVHIDLRPWGEEIAMNLQLLQDRVRTETPQGAYHNVVRWVHRSSFVVRPPPRGAVRTYSYTPHGSRGAPTTPRIPIPDSNGMFVDSGWYGTIVVETEGTNESLADLQDRCGPGAFPPRARGVNGQGTSMDRESKKVFRILREKSRPGEIWIRTVSAKERLL